MAGYCLWEVWLLLVRLRFGDAVWLAVVVIGCVVGYIVVWLCLLFGCLV